ncbi:uncharacterized protein LOC108679077 isoform X2 [Hyalella azteca]|uniref:Uncharacterized protein LOC108679077 isoform X2 n=1 Tax=Hyalella azteca TaxID=294128 RepID=A0A979FU78_HYAAZ|nr:uncharacterized protein LOC108679077 isoform X2 [Hyalella azteca]
MAGFLALVAEATNAISGALIISCLLLVTLLILRFQHDNPSSVVHVQHQPVQVAVQKLFVPYTLALCTSADNDVQESGLKARVRCGALGRGCLVRWWWGALMSDLAQLLHAPWQHFSNCVVNDTAFEGLQGGSKVLEAGDHELLLETKEALTLGCAPRQRYPLVVVQLNTDACQHDVQVGCLVTIVHVADALCPEHSRVLYQYLKQCTGQLTMLTTLYTQSNGTSHNSTSSSKAPATHAKPDLSKEAGIASEDIDESFSPCHPSNHKSHDDGQVDSFGAQNVLNSTAETVNESTSKMRTDEDVVASGVEVAVSNCSCVCTRENQHLEKHAEISNENHSVRNSMNNLNEYKNIVGVSVRKRIRATEYQEEVPDYTSNVPTSSHACYPNSVSPSASPNDSNPVRSQNCKSGNEIICEAIVPNDSSESRYNVPSSSLNMSDSSITVSNYNYQMETLTHAPGHAPCIRSSSENKDSIGNYPENVQNCDRKTSNSVFDYDSSVVVDSPSSHNKMTTRAQTLPGVERNLPLDEHKLLLSSRKVIANVEALHPAVQESPADGQNCLDGRASPADGQNCRDGRASPADGQNCLDGRASPADGQNSLDDRASPAIGQELLSGSHAPFPGTHNISEPASDDCVVCQVESVSIALLPCCHVCVCWSCFSHLMEQRQACPLCRQHVTAYFIV